MAVIVSMCRDMVPWRFVSQYKHVFSLSTMDPILNEHNKDEFPPAHTAEHLLNQTMIRMFGCERSNNAHIERKKSKITYILDSKPDRKAEREIERRMNELIEEDMPVTFELRQVCVSGL